MKNAVVSVPVLFLALSSSAVELPKVGAPKFADMEADVKAPVCLWKEGAQTVAITIECDTAKNNAMRVFLGADKNKDGKLSMEELGVRLGWDAGHWFIEDFITAKRLSYESKSDKVRKTFTLTWTLGADGRCESLLMCEDGAVVQSSKGASALRYFDKSWNLARIVRNGVVDPNEKITLEVR